MCTIDKTFFDECFLFHVIAWKHCFLYKFIVTRIVTYVEFCYNRHVAAFFETSVLKEVRILHPLFPQ